MPDHFWVKAEKFGHLINGEIFQGSTRFTIYYHSDEKDWIVYNDDNVDAGGGYLFITEPIFSSDKKYVCVNIVGGEVGNLVFINTKTLESSTYYGGEFGCMSPLWIPDQNKVIYIGYNPQESGVFIYDMVSEKTEELSELHNYDFNLSEWIVPGKVIKFYNNREGYKDESSKPIVYDLEKKMLLE